MNRNKESTRYYSDAQEKEVCKVIRGQQTPNSGAGYFSKGDVVNTAASMLCECKCSMSDKNSFSIKKEWLEKNKMEMREKRLDNHCVAFNFGPNSESYYIIEKKLMKYLIDKLEEGVI